MKSIRIVIIDDHPLVCEGLRNMLENETEIQVVGIAHTGTEALTVIKNRVPDLVFLDINLPDISGIDLCKQFKRDYPAMKCIGLSTFNDRSYISHMIENGAAGYLLKNASREEILQAVKQVNNGGMYLNLLEQSTSSSSSLTSQHPFITRREKEVLQLIAEGLTNQQIADKLFVSITTINSHRKNLLTKFEVSNTAALIRIAVEKRLI